MKYELVVIGAGPGGYAASLKGAKNGLKTALIEADLLGGTCLNRGCIPTKLFLGATEPIAGLKAQQRLRLASGEIKIDLKKLQQRKKSLISATHRAMTANLKKLGVDLISGQARLLNSSTLEVSGADKQKIEFDHLIIATGSKNATLPGLIPDHQNILDSNDILDLESVPEKLAIIGAGAIGIELGQFFSRLGSQIVLIEAKNRVVPAEDPDISKELEKVLKREKWTIKTNTLVQKLESNQNSVTLHLRDEKFEVDKCLVAIGRSPNIENLGLDNANIKTYGMGWIKTNDYLQAAPHIYAIGDVNGQTLLAHAASDQGEYCIDHILGQNKNPYPQNPIPSCIYGSFEIIRTGLTAAQLEAQGKEFSVTKTSLIANPIAQAHGAGYGFIKVLWSEGRVAGITAIGYNVSHLVTLAQVIVDQAWSRDEVEKHVFAHPTLDESLKEALLNIT